MKKFIQIFFKTIFLNNLNKDKKEIFTGFCKEQKHFNELKYFCKSHNELCCAACISKIKDDDNGQHNNCEVCKIVDIKNDKQNKLKENIKYLENFQNIIDQSINELKKIVEKINENKENIKLKIQKIFTKIRTSLNDREDELLLEVDKQYNSFILRKILLKNGKSYQIK